MSTDIDGVEAAGTFGLLSGALSVLLPYFLGPTVALAGLLVALVTVRADAARGLRRSSLALPVASAVAGWALLLVAPLGAWRGLVLAGCCAPLWWRARRAPAFGGG